MGVLGGRGRKKTQQRKIKTVGPDISKKDLIKATVKGRSTSRGFALSDKCKGDR